MVCTLIVVALLPLADAFVRHDNRCPTSTDSISVNSCGAQSIGNCGTSGCPANSQCKSSNQFGDTCLCKQPFCSDGKSCTCQSDTSGTCTVLDCWSIRKAKCVKTGYFESQCICPPGTCAVCGICQPIPLSESPTGVAGQLVLAADAPPQHEFLPALILASAGAFMIALPSALGASWAWRRWTESRSGDMAQPFIEVSD